MRPEYHDEQNTRAYAEDEQLTQLMGMCQIGAASADGEGDDHPHQPHQLLQKISEVRPVTISSASLRPRTGKRICVSPENQASDGYGALCSPFTKVVSSSELTPYLLQDTTSDSTHDFTFPPTIPASSYTIAADKHRQPRRSK
ncbi:unnamed protein product [Phytophthora fragariaefolia]|uniref:Unnamed protein product n=1 Tax=Phytophthora fragariaefolia TaxID=1490495 RepID=A0A9W7D5Y5_9STRA|nr:unnamed protein product [Phytophthora fragariaefolia]